MRLSLLCCLALPRMSALRAGSGMAGKIALVTGSTDGIGQHTASKLAQAGATVLLHGRSPARLQATRELILKQCPDAQLETYCYDLQSMSATKQLAAEVLERHASLDVLINNAGVFQSTRILSPDALESTFAVNVAATFILICKLFPLLRLTPHSRILNISSISQSDLGKIDLKNLQLERGFSAYNSYSLSKLCVAALSHELALRVSPPDVLVQSCDPGTVNTKMLLAGWGRCGIDISSADHEFELVTKEYSFGPDDSTSASAPPAASAHGQYFINSRVSRCCPDVYDAKVREGLWEKLEDITGEKLPM
ncbi:short-chain dehydrogenase-like protein [Ochromonadaceae sp. CCMP2298]|nr:short-chain dehydrogenase-like protein [Ochromonadaceae sp. CCMP2298]|mmetsp:Transcript_30615/g.69432  ORF Transcript_30615/g.69432 Transcript_30615/m.69432 type:complete len:309 (+) Transcript_30615:1-927(+)